MPVKQQAANGREPRRHNIRVRGPIGPTMMQAFPTLVASRSGQDTLLSGSLQDQCALYGVIHQLEALGLELMEITQARAPESSERCDVGSSGPRPD
jgi:epsilon-lactone hydrolase